VCDQQFDNADQLQRHVNMHFEEEEQAASGEHFCFT